MATVRRLGSPNHLVWQYYECLHRQLRRVPDCDLDGTQKQEILLVVFLSVATLETFLNLFFRVTIEDVRYAGAREAMLVALAAKRGIDRKIREWPTMVFNRALDQDNPAVRAFMDLKNLRNSLMHVTSSHETAELPGPIFIHGLVDLSALHGLSVEYARQCPAIVRGFVSQLFAVAGIQAEDRDHLFHYWFGEINSQGRAE